MVGKHLPKLSRKFKSLGITSFGEAPASYKPNAERRFSTWTYGKVEKNCYYQEEVNAAGKADGKGILVSPGYDVSIGYHEELGNLAKGL